MNDLPLPLLRSLVALAETGSLARAAIRMGRSESALSLQMRKLEESVGVVLFDRDGRALKFNQDGLRLLGHARAILARVDAARTEFHATKRAGKVRFGIVQDFAGPILTRALTNFRENWPDMQIEIAVDGSSDLLKALGEERIDFALCAGAPVGPDAPVSLAMAWFGDAALLTETVLPIAAVTPNCPYLKAAQEALDSVGRPYRLSLTTPSLDGLRAAITAGLGIACRTETALNMTPLPTDSGLPSLPSITYQVARRPNLGRAAEGMIQVLKAQFGNLENPPQNQKAP
jgi:DNA-binding transcriptional LysR family regulator